MLRLFLSLALNLAGQTAPDPSEWGPMTPVNGIYKFEAVQVPAIPYPVDIWATVWWPDGFPGGPRPLLIFLHGNHGICRQPGTQFDFATPLAPPACPPGFEPTPNHTGYDFVASRLASHGYIVASINANAINVRANGNPERGRLVQEHLRYWARWNSPQGAQPWGTLFSGKVDLNNVGLMGHSRGGEGVRAAYTFNRGERAPAGIKAVLEVGPVDFGRTTPPTGATTGNQVFDSDNVTWSVILPGCDGDVFTNQGMRVYDRARIARERTNPTPKSQIYVFGANHNFYNGEWIPEDGNFQCIDFPIITDRPRQEATGLVYMMGFFRTYIGGENFKSLFTGEAAPPASVTVPVETSFTESREKILIIDDFSDRLSPDKNTAGGDNLANNIELTRCAAQRCNEPPPGSWLHDDNVSAGKLAWPGKGEGGSRLTLGTAAENGTRDFSTFARLAFRVAEQFDRRNPLGGNQNFSVRLIDSTGASSNAVELKSYGNLGFPTGYFVRRSVLKTIRIPLSDLRGVDLTKISQVQFLFDKTPTGAIFLTDVHVTP